jgi:hypothetical protein
MGCGLSGPEAQGFTRAQTGHNELKSCVFRARRVRGLATSDSGLIAHRRLIGIEGLLVLTLLASGQIWTNTTTTTPVHSAQPSA